MSKKRHEQLAQFTDRELGYILQYAESHLAKDYAPADGTLQGSILTRLKQIIYGVR
jgi:hypothetical protein